MTVSPTARQDCWGDRGRPDRDLCLQHLQGSLLSPHPHPGPPASPRLCLPTPTLHPSSPLPLPCSPYSIPSLPTAPPTCSCGKAGRGCRRHVRGLRSRPDSAAPDHGRPCIQGFGAKVLYHNRCALEQRGHPATLCLGAQPGRTLPRCPSHFLK